MWWSCKLCQCCTSCICVVHPCMSVGSGILLFFAMPCYVQILHFDARCGSETFFNLFVTLLSERTLATQIDVFITMTCFRYLQDDESQFHCLLSTRTSWTNRIQHLLSQDCSREGFVSAQDLIALISLAEWMEWKATCRYWCACTPSPICWLHNTSSPEDLSW